MSTLTKKIELWCGMGVCVYIHEGVVRRLVAGVVWRSGGGRGLSCLELLLVLFFIRLSGKYIAAFFEWSVCMCLKFLTFEDGKSSYVFFMLFMALNLWQSSGKYKSIILRTQ